MIRARGIAPATTFESWGACVHLLALQKLFGVMLPEEAQVSIFTWRLRGWIDGFFSPQRHKDAKLPGNKKDSLMSLSLGGFAVKQDDILDYYRVDALEPNRLLRLYSLLKAPGEGWMEWIVSGTDSPSYTLLTQTDFFAPRSLPGFLYWYLLYPFHAFVFRGLIGSISRQSLLLHLREGRGERESI